jgi:hypothetical protein
MGAIDNFLKRWGFARLDRYGLVLTPEGRVLSTRPAVLDDGLGSKIVGWLDGDLAAMELEHWGAAKPAVAKPVAAIPRLQSPPQAPLAARVVAPAAPIRTTALPGVAPMRPVAPAPVDPPPAPVVAPVSVIFAPVAAPIPTPEPVVAPVVAEAPPVEEDEWEWEIAVARARAEAEEVEQARLDLLGASAVIASAVIPRKTSPGIAVPVPKPDPESWDPPAPPPKPADPILPAITQQRTVIPVPQLPTAARPSDVRPAPHTPTYPRRMARGTGRLDDTVRTQPAPPRTEDQTSPYVTLPAEVKPVGYAHTKRVAAKQR